MGGPRPLAEGDGTGTPAHPHRANRAPPIRVLRGRSSAVHARHADDGHAWRSGAESRRVPGPSGGRRLSAHPGHTDAISTPADLGDPRLVTMPAPCERAFPPGCAYTR